MNKPYLFQNKCICMKQFTRYEPVKLCFSREVQILYTSTVEV